MSLYEVGKKERERGRDGDPFPERGVWKEEKFQTQEMNSTMGLWEFGITAKMRHLEKINK